MRSRWIVVLAAALAMPGGAAAEETLEAAAGSSVAYLDTGRAATPDSQAVPDRLNYLRGSAACPAARRCSGSAHLPRLDPALAERDYIDSLKLVTYGDMDVKFTGDRVKLKVRF